MAVPSWKVGGALKQASLTTGTRQWGRLSLGETLRAQAPTPALPSPLGLATGNNGLISDTLGLYKLK